jgi:hypothetical protein
MLVYTVGNGVHTYLATPSLRGASTALRWLRLRGIKSVITKFQQHPKYWDDLGEVESL